QHEPQGLLDPETHIAVLDRHAGLADDAESLGGPFRRLREVEAELEALRRDRREAERRREMLDYQAAEIERANLSAGEEEALRQEKQIQASAGRLAELSGDAYRLLYDDEDAVVSRLGQVYRKVEELASIDPRLAPHLEAKAGVRAALDDLALFLRDYREGLQVSPGRLDEIESRLDLVERLKRKYGATVEEVIAFGARCRADLVSLGSPEEREAALQREREELAGKDRASARRSCSTRWTRASAAAWPRSSGASCGRSPSAIRSCASPICRRSPPWPTVTSWCASAWSAEGRSPTSGRSPTPSASRKSPA